ncbi:RNA polymerase sigma factor [Nocardioides zhouii]|uniref:Sigma-70 family RNA polymerase sigma factor n=1 Tax=Nocardioides zhouii TaxID=1168729 RepID=A0A4V1RND3_9ACTN|nr:sigma-70 family RNA polymerase sigma factor [Nocardioides zhouii]RYC05457.1 sigma-70 family RNA polymerase sigma factor [Nocardioides zhouii]
MNRDEEQEFTDFVTHSSPRLLTFAQLLIGDQGEAEDALQVALMRLTRHWHRGLEAPTAYVRQTLVNIARDRARRRHLVPLLTTSGRSLDGSAVDGPSAVVVREAIDDLLEGLPPRQRVAVVLRVVEGCSEAETAALMRCAPGTVKSNLARGLERLRANHARRLTGRDEPVTDDRPAPCRDPYEGAST